MPELIMVQQQPTAGSEPPTELMKKSDFWNGYWKADGGGVGYKLTDFPQAADNALGLFKLVAKALWADFVHVLPFPVCSFT